MKQYLFYLVFLLTLVIVSCKGDSTKEAQVSEEVLIQAYIDSLALDISADADGLFAYPVTLNPGGKTQLEGDVLKLYYKMDVLGGGTIDVQDSLDTDSLIVKQGANAIYPIGLDLALAYMREGEKWSFIIPSKLGFSDFAFSTLIPENAVLLVDIKLLSIQSEDDILNHEIVAIGSYVDKENLRDTAIYPLNQPEFLPNGMVVKRIKGSSGSLLGTAELAAVLYDGYFLDGTVFDRAAAGAPFQFSYGESLLNAGFQLTIDRMRRGERFLTIIPSYLAYKESAQVIPAFLTDEMIARKIVPPYVAKVPPYRPVVFQIELIQAN